MQPECVSGVAVQPIVLSVADLDVWAAATLGSLLGNASPQRTADPHTAARGRPKRKSNRGAPRRQPGSLAEKF